MKRSKTHYKDILTCSTCNKTYTRSNVSRHKKTKYHLLCEKHINAIKNILLKPASINKKSIKDMVKKQYTDDEGKIYYLTKEQFIFYSELTNNILKEV